MKTKKTVKISETDLVNLIDKIINEAVQVKKEEWIKEEASKGIEKTSILESKVADLEAKLNTLIESKK